jgi:hypothetical protein
MRIKYRPTQTKKAVQLNPVHITRKQPRWISQKTACLRILIGEKFAGRYRGFIIDFFKDSHRTAKVEELYGYAAIIIR